MRLISLLLLGVAACGNSTLNNCKTFVDRSGANDDRTVNFGGALGLVYSPACIEVASGQTVVFAGDFTEDPIAPGTGPGNSGVGSPNNPISSEVATGAANAAFVFAGSGTEYPYYCQAHVSVGMAGVVKVK